MKVEITSINYVTASPYMTKARLAKAFDVSTRTVIRRINELETYVAQGRYSPYTIIRDGGMTYVNFLAYIDYLTYKKDLESGKRVPKYNPSNVAAQIAWEELQKQVVSV